MRRAERLPQRLLAIELRMAIDRATRRPSDTQAVELALELAHSHPRAMRSSHVRRNVGRARLAWLACQVAATQPLVGGVSEEG